MKHCQENKGLNLHAFVIMSNHLHVIVSSDKIPLNDIVRDLKKFTCKELISTILQTNESRSVWLLKKFKFAAERIQRGVNYKVWQDGFHPAELSTNVMIERRLDYVHNNPVEQGLVYNPED